MVELHILTDTQSPISLPQYCIPDHLKEAIKDEIESLKAQNTIESSTSAWNAPIVPVMKPTGAVRLCVDYRRLNQVTAQEHHFMPELDDILSKVGDS